ncbi:sigma-70 family RNA polymerase sigma factor [Sorangium sp. So ce327]|jgi:RNA polymerase sigma-70 factor (ECF subfamily)|uniref:RNA polymerase sigma factor n=1 Tax=unclassified Sorangium TaxID=2621164 RepID=UPI003F5ED3D4
MGKSPCKTGPANEKPPLTLEAIMAEHQDTIRRYVERHGFRGADQEDLVQEIFHGAARSLPRFDPRLASMRTWLLRIAFNLISNERNRACRRHEELWPEEALDGLSSDAPDSETRLIAAQRSEVLAELLQEVPLTRRAILVAHDLEEETIQQIAAEYAMPRNTVWNHLRLARLALKAAEQRRRARSRGRGALLAPLALALGAVHARAAAGPLHGGRLRRLLDWARCALRRAPSHREASPTASSRRTSRAATRAAGRSAASAAAGAVAGALVLLAPGGRDDLPLRPAHALALRAPLATWVVHGGQTLPSASELPSEKPAVGPAGGALEPALRDPTNQRSMPGAPKSGGALSTSEHRLMRRAISMLAAGRDDAARLLLERHRREFPRGIYRGEREELLRRLSAAARYE